MSLMSISVGWRSIYSELKDGVKNEMLVQLPDMRTDEWVRIADVVFI